MERGRVSSFNKKERYGFLEVRGRENVFFRACDGQLLFPGEQGIVFSGRQIIHGAKVVALSDPRVGDRILFNRMVAQPHDRAIVWGYARDYERAKALLVRQAENKRYRLLLAFRNRGMSIFGPSAVFWEGKDVIDLARRFPRGRLWAYLGVRDTSAHLHFEGKIRFQRFEHGTWVSCADPRPRQVPAALPLPPARLHAVAAAVGF